MKFFKHMKDGGPESRVWGFFVVEIKSLFSVVLLHFKDGSREGYHSHAFNSISWVLKGALEENCLLTLTTFRFRYRRYFPSWKPVLTRREDMHKVSSEGDTWVLSFRGPWSKTWKEYLPDEDTVITLTHGRQVVEGA